MSFTDALHVSASEGQSRVQVYKFVFFGQAFALHSVLSSYLLIKHIPSAIMGQFALLGLPKKDFGMDNFFYWANIAHHLF